MMELLPELALLVPAITGVIEAFKVLGMSTRFAPVLSIGLGLLGAYVLTGSFDTAAMFQGVLAGLSASGLYSGVRKTLNV